MDDRCSVIHSLSGKLDNDSENTGVAIFLYCFALSHTHCMHYIWMNNKT